MENNVNEDPRFPGDSSIAPLSENKGSGPTAENPGNVHPVNDPGAGQYPPESEEHQQGPSIYRSIENPYALKEAMNKLESALDEIIKLFKGEGQTLSKDGDFAEGNAAIKKFKAWRQEVEDIKRGKE